MMNKILLAAVAIMMSTTISNAMPIGSGIPQLQTHLSNNQVQLVSGRKFKRAKRRNNRQHNNQLSASRGGVKDTCPGGNQGCIKDLIAACDKAGGGLSTEPDGGVDCFVVGIHDQ